LKKREIIDALLNPDLVISEEILRKLTLHPKWSEIVLHRCPLCGYETDATNVHRHCPRAPLDLNISNKAPEYMRHMAVPMYVVDKTYLVVIE